ncbi:Gfo/Idh/MocA family oxidoreductase [Paenibacillus sp. DMB5]|uniref:Gfo/Idh/MocA family protein n=1 Tax=Paenibacillus sp. DMB5 TaxID=1780103 RepID=UPI00076D0639|nr:Gfo/Idh/MocA family oxidoreductase [Paenibacillus sp. DMB5]KUP25915.1 NAD(P)-dependent oxidoreductase [Paenibacillus sp. DMB5]
MKLGIIGTGVIVQEFLPKLVELKGIEIIGLQGIPSEIDAVKKMASEHNIPHATSSFEELYETGIDTVYVAVPNFLHFDYCKKALDKGINVIVEKPMTSNYREALELKKLAQEKRLFLFEAITTLYLGNYKKIQEWLPQIGEIKIVQSQYSQYSRRYDAFQKGEVLPAFDPKKAGGALMDLNLYNLHFVMGMFGKPEGAEYFANVERDIDTSGTMILRYPSFYAICTAAKDCKGIYGGIIQGTKGCIKNVYPPNLIGEVSLELNDGTVEKFDDGSARERLIPEFTAFVKAINEQDYDFCYEKLERSLAVSEVQTNARLKAGILFPVDEQVN